jgi:hypothetical protein
MVAYVQGQKIVTPEVVEKQAEKLFAPPSPRPSVPPVLPPLPDEPEQFTNSALHKSRLHLLRRHMVRSARALVTVGVCATLLWAGVLAAKEIRVDRFTTALAPIVQKGTQALAVFFPQSLFAQPAVNEPSREPRRVPKEQQRIR